MSLFVLLLDSNSTVAQTGECMYVCEYDWLVGLIHLTYYYLVWYFTCKYPVMRASNQPLHIILCDDNFVWAGGGCLFISTFSLFRHSLRSLHSLPFQLHIFHSKWICYFSFRYKLNVNAITAEVSSIEMKTKSRKKNKTKSPTKVLVFERVRESKHNTWTK